jgi:hypothetical protein
VTLTLKELNDPVDYVRAGPLVRGVQLRTYVPTYLRTYVLTYLRTYVLTYLRTYVLTYLRTYVLTYLRTYVLTSRAQLCLLARVPQIRRPVGRMHLCEPLGVLRARLQ